MAAWGAHGGATIHTATHFGAPLACAAASAVLEELRARSLPERAAAVGSRWMQRLRERTAGRGVSAVTGRGLMIGVALEGGGARALATTRRLLERGWLVLTGGVGGEVLTLTPPLDVDEALLDAFADVLPACLS
jgi:4-aminobutyrate aminotransferase/(S)-3-amino-2-methylpropionate transaminase